ncbi:MAG: hypothetical protein LBL45_07830 [Treponema sp.]|jgi:hypothetical protein|nr:hypothetical protein [Treponema sp.]
MSKNVQIPMWLFHKTLDFLENFNSSSCGAAFREQYADVLDAFRQKSHSLKLRRAYADIVFAQDEQSRFDARMQYLLKQRERISQ